MSMTIGLALAVTAAQASPAAALPCDPLPGMEQVLARPAVNYILMGEYHGTVEMPKVTADAVCAVALAKRPVIVGVEFPPENQSAIDAYLKSEGAAAARAALLSAPAWKEEGGRTTSAIFDLIEQARRLSSAGYPVTVVAFDLVPQPVLSKEREEGLARGLAEARAKVPNSLVVALTGVGHAGKSLWTSQNPPFRAASQLLPPAETLSFFFVRAGGEFWGCHPAGGGPPGECKAYDMPVREPAGVRGIRLDGSLREGFDGFYSAGTKYTASKPAAR